MEFQTLRKSHKKEIIIGVSIFVILAVVLVVRFTFAKYNLVKSIKIAEGTINYKVPDFKIMAMYKQKDDVTCTEDSCYNEMAEGEAMPESGYIINEDKTYCTLNNQNKDSNAKIYTDEDGNYVISGLSIYDKCYLYFDKKVSAAGETILENITVKSGTPDFSKTAQVTCSGVSDPCETTNGVYKAKDDNGDTYYFRGAVENNYVKFANKYWRIIRINGDGSIRLIYDGTSVHTNGTPTSDSIAVDSQLFNASYNNNMYVGFKYTANQVHGLGTKSNALTQLETWYTNNLSSYAAKIDTNAGFCGDRTPSTSSSTSNGSGGTGATITSYGASIRLVNSTKAPVLTCADANDLYTVSSSNKGNKSLTYPIGLITADEVAMAGGVYGTMNNNYYLYNGKDYWTLSPCAFVNGSAEVFVVTFNSRFYSSYLTAGRGLRPVINIRSDVKLSGKGTTSDPYVVS